MGYRTIKRVLGETSLERKCRLLFGTCLFLLIAIAFIWVDQIAENLIRDNRVHAQQALQERCRGLAELQLLAMHFEVWVTTQADDEDPGQQEVQTDAIKRLSKGLIDSEYEWQILTLKKDPPVTSRKPGTAEEAAALQYLLEQVSASRTKEELEEVLTNPAEGGEGEYDPPSIVLTDAPTLFYDHNVGERYTFYHAVTWNSSCTNFCHIHDPGSMSSAMAGGTPISESEKLFAVKITLNEPLSVSSDAIDWIRAILSAAGITTFFFAMVALYVIVRYVIVKPLSHLREVSVILTAKSFSLSLMGVPPAMADDILPGSWM